MQNYIQILLLLVLASVASARVTPSNKFEEGLLKVIEKCKEGDVQSLPLPFSPLRSLEIPFMGPVSYDGYRTSLSGVNIEGLDNLSVRKLSASPSDMTLTLEFNIPTVAVQAERYHLRAVSGWNPLDDRGYLESTIKNVNVRADARFGAEGKNTVITFLTLDISVGHIQLSLSDTWRWVRDKVKNKIPKMIKDSRVKGQIQNKIKDMVGEHLRGRTPQEFVEIISAI